MKKLNILLSLCLCIGIFSSCGKKSSPSEEILPQKEIIGTPIQIEQANSIGGASVAASGQLQSIANSTKSVSKSMIKSTVKSFVVTRSLTKASSGTQTINQTYYCKGYDQIDSDGDVDSRFSLTDTGNGSVTFTNFAINYNVDDQATYSRVHIVSNGFMSFNNCKTTVLDLENISSFDGSGTVPYKNLTLQGTLQYINATFDWDATGSFSQNGNLQIQKTNGVEFDSGKIVTPSSFTFNGHALSLDLELKLTGTIDMTYNTSTSAVSGNIAAKGYYKITGTIDSNQVKLITPLTYNRTY